ncbi:Uncharacterized protein APZ42_033815 [Daphnia magna]|uniref:Uncharacterized protein n=1 Tax=Daphnia magna TaxID=35525 RepID=A0A164KQ27_9CRUS|nr:Uncharacterized protein APZ42_033815 [Daphnia magna]
MTATLHFNSWQHCNLSRTFIQFTSRYRSVQYTCFSELSKSIVTIKYIWSGKIDFIRRFDYLVWVGRVEEPRDGASDDSA